ncbi:GNAT family N-acetyltransferase [Actinobacillus porcinus]|uniref:GNAT family N-acetyltransferase n=1 Tax=Actinobacillus porcinus TaxID=51048 RepID=UPI0023560CC6|nr:GNAT family protein [Actinobacillus porcinus]
MRYNEFNQPIGDALPDFQKGEKPEAICLNGRFCRLEKLSAQKHGKDLFEVYSSSLENWTYIPLEPFSQEAALIHYLEQLEQSNDPYYFAIIDKAAEQAVGTFSLMRIDLNNRAIEVGWVVFSPKMQRSKIGTEAHFLLASYVFETLQYRRYEWKCDSLNRPSNQAALRLGFSFEGTFRRAQVYKGRSRDTNWYSMLDSEWEFKKQRLLRWLADDNFDENGVQKVALSAI